MPHNLRLALCFALFMVFCSCPRAQADERDQIYICARNIETDKMYHAAAYQETGAELNGVSHSSAYDPIGDYLLVLWDQNHTSIMAIKGPFSAPTTMPTNAIDQDGHAWEISLFASEMCR